MTSEALAAVFEGAALGDVVMALRNAAAAQFVSPIEVDGGEVWIARA